MSKTTYTKNKQATPSVAYDDTNLRNRVTALESKRDNDNQNLSINNRTISISGGNSITLPEDRDTIYNDTDIKRRLTALEGKTDNFVTGVTASRTGNKVKLTYNFVTGQPKTVEFDDKDTIGIAYDDTALRNRVKTLEDKIDRDNQTLTFNESNRTLFLSGGNSVTLPNDKQTISKSGNKIVLSNGGGEVDIPTATPYNDTEIKSRLGALEAKRDNDNQTLSLSGNNLTISGGNSVSIPQPDLRGYVSISAYNELKDALVKLLQDLKNSGAWEQTGDNILDGRLKDDRHIATGNINLFGGQPDGNSFIRTNNGSTENDLTGGI